VRVAGRLWKCLLGVQGCVVEALELGGPEGSQEVVALLRPSRCRRQRCGICGRRSPGYDRGGGRRRWRGLDLGHHRVYLEAELRRVRCRDHGVVVAHVPWARHDSDFTRDFENQVAWLATQTSKSATRELMRIAWRTVGAIVQRVCKEAEARRDLLEGLTRLGIDEISHRKGQRYLTVVIDHDSGRLLWAGEGRESATLAVFFDLLGPERSARVQFVSADGAGYIEKVVRERCPNATLCLDPFHVVSWATEALDDVRRLVWNEARQNGMTTAAKELKDARYALWKNPENLTARQGERLSAIEKTNAPLYRAYLLKEQLRQLLRLPVEQGLEMLAEWLAWASRSRLEAFVKLARNIRERRGQIKTLLEHRLSNAMTESVNTRIRLIMRRGFGFHTAAAVIALAKLALSGLCPTLPGRQLNPLLRQ